MMEHSQKVLNEDQIQSFLNDGVVVVDGILESMEVENALEGLRQTLLSEFGVDPDNLLETGQGLLQLSSTNGSGGVLDLFYPSWKQRVALNPRLFFATCQLWQAAYSPGGESLSDFLSTDRHRWHPYGPYCHEQGFAYIDRIGFRVPTTIAEQLGERTSEKRKKKSRARAIQRSLTPHLDCCPDTLWAQGKSKWRPIQCFVSLTDTLDPGMGGFEAAKGFHREFDDWAISRPPTTLLKKNKQDGTLTSVSFPAPCLGEYTHIRPVEDAEVMNRVRHIPVRAGAAVFWDNRIPHANSYRNDSSVTRAVVYCSFLPNVELNRQYVKQQLCNYRKRRKPNDTWIEVEDGDAEDRPTDAAVFEDELTILERKLLGIDPWEE